MPVTLTVTWAWVQWSGLVLLILSVIALFTGDLPGNEGNGAGNALRWVAWPLLGIWLLVMLVKGIFF